QDIVDNYRIVQSVADKPELYAFAGTLPNGHEVHLHKEYLEASVRILTGFIEPHFFAGFSGGPKSVAPGIASRDDIMYIHSAQLIGHPKSTWGILEGNPVHQAISQIAHLTEVHLVVNVAVNKNKEITRVWAGRLNEVHGAGTEFVNKTSMCPVADYFDVVITTNSGYPLDLNLYQAVKGMSAAARVVKSGGDIVCVAECWDGVPEHGNFKKILEATKSAQDILDMVYAPGFAMTDQWQAQTLALILQRAKIHMVSGCLSDEEISLAHLQPSGRVEDVLQRILRRDPEATICVLPEGPQTIPYVKSKE
ncbi:MAG: nickel-dependent lactate racemase, partial [Limnochordia bacterium]|nr:nickel-dependent lactate racemase [Limnochordia bacterium]